MLVRMLLWQSFVSNESVSGGPDPCLVALMEWNLLTCCL